MMMIVIISQIASHLSTRHNSHDPEPTLMETEPAHTTLDLTPICLIIIVIFTMMKLLIINIIIIIKVMGIRISVIRTPSTHMGSKCDPNLFDYNRDLQHDEVAHHQHQGPGDSHATHPTHPHGQLM